MSAQAVSEKKEAAPKKKGGFSFPAGITTLGIVAVLVWIAAFFIPSGQYQRDESGSPVPGSFEPGD